MGKSAAESLEELEAKTKVKVELPSKELSRQFGGKKRVDSKQISGVVFGVLVGSQDNILLVDHPDNETKRPLPARSLVPVDKERFGGDVALMFEEGDPARPIVIGFPVEPGQTTTRKPIEIELDDDRLLLTAEREIVLRCGKASITLTRAGKILLRGAYLLSRSSGVNKIKGGSVQIN